MVYLYSYLVQIKFGNNEKEMVKFDKTSFFTNAIYPEKLQRSLLFYHSSIELASSSVRKKKTKTENKQASVTNWFDYCFLLSIKNQGATANAILPLVE